MSTVPSQTIDRSYLIMALLDVCAFASDRVSDDPDGQNRITGNIAHVLRHTLELVEETHDDIERDTSHTHTRARAES